MLAKITIADYMTKHVLTLHQDVNVKEAIKTLLAHKVTSAPVLDAAGHIVGMFSEKDCMQAVLAQAYNQGGAPNVAEFMTADIVAVHPEDSIVDLAERFHTSQVRSFPVLDDGQLVGIISRTDVLHALVSI